MHAGERAAERRGVERERSVAVFLQRSGEELGQGMATTATILHAECFGRAIACPFVVRQTHRRRWWGCAAASYEGQGIGGPRRHARTASARALSSTQFCQRAFQGLPTAGRRRHQGDRRFHALVARISIDEAFAGVAGCTHLFGPPTEIATAIRQRVRSELGLPNSVGIARTKHLAKTASQVAKPDGLMVVSVARHGHSRQAHCTSLTLAEWFCRTADRIDPA